MGWARSLDHGLTTGALDPGAPGRSYWCLDAPWLDPESTEAGNVRFAGRVPAAELDRLYRHALCVVAPAHHEDYGLTAIEAMAYGKPVIVCSDGGGLADFVEDGVNGFVVEPEPAAIAAAVQRLVDDRGLAERLGRAARERAQEFTWENAMRQFDAAVERVMA